MLHKVLPGSTPFLYFSDHDVQGIHIFLTLKHGARTTAYASDIMVCPRLQWVGPTMQGLLDHHRKTHDNTAIWPSREAILLAKMSKKLTRTDRSLLKGIKGLDVLQHEPILKTEVPRIEAGHGVSRYVSPV